LGETAHVVLWASALLLLCSLSLIHNAEAVRYIPGEIDWTPVVNGTWLISPIMVGYGADHFGEIVAEAAMWYENYTDKALIMDIANKGKSLETIAKRTLKEGAKKGYGKPRMIWQPSPAYLAGFGDIARDGTDMKWVGIPTVEISYPIWALVKYLSENNYELNGVPVKFKVAVRDDERNPAASAWSYGTVVITSIVLTACCLACYAVNLYKLYYHLRYTAGATTAKIFFFIDDFANFMRFWWVCINPFYVNRFGYTWTTMCTTTHVALSLICTLLLSLKWRELLLKTKLQVTIFLDTFKWPFFALSAFIFGFELISSALRGHWYDITKTNIASLSILTINAFGVCILLFISGGQIMSQIRRAVGSRRRVLQLSQTTIIILFSGVFLFAWMCFELVFLVTTYKTGTGVLKINAISVGQNFCLFIASFLQNWAMPVPYPNGQNTTMLSTRGTNSRAGKTVSSKKNSSDGTEEETNHTTTNDNPASYNAPGKAGPSTSSDDEDGTTEDSDSEDSELIESSTTEESSEDLESYSSV
jgi:hypothetical protein